MEDGWFVMLWKGSGDLWRVERGLGGSKGIVGFGMVLLGSWIAYEGQEGLVGSWSVLEVQTLPGKDFIFFM